MFNVHKVEKEIGGKLLSLETGRIARQAHGAVIAQMARPWCWLRLSPRRRALKILIIFR
ncbi:MAG: hypothetical protein ACO20W_05215 [Anaerohalosphaeraceae bacterium]